MFIICKEIDFSFIYFLEDNHCADKLTFVRLNNRFDLYDKSPSTIILDFFYNMYKLSMFRLI